MALVGQVRIPYEFRQLTINNGLPDNIVYSCMQDSRGYIWFCTGNGVSRFDGRKFQHFGVSQGLADSEILKATEDLEGRIWFHTINGRLSYFDTKTERIISYRESPTLQNANGSAYLTTITEGGDSSLWILVERSFLKRMMPNGDLRHYNIKNKQVFGVFKDEQNRIFMAGDTFRLYDSKRDSFVDWVTFANPEKRNRMGRWCDVGKGIIFFESDEGIFEFRNGVFRKAISKEIFKNQFVRSISADTLSNLWVGASNGFYRFDQNNKKIPYFNEIKSHVAHVFTDKEGNRWVCTMGSGVYFFPAGYDNISTLRKVDGLEGDEVTALSLNPKGDIVIATYPNIIHFWDRKKGRIYRKIQVNGLWDVRVKRLFFPNEHDFWLQTDNYRLDFYPNFSQKVPPQYSMGDSKVKEVLALNIDLKLYSNARTQDEEYPIVTFLNRISPFKNIYFAKNGRMYTTSGLITELTPLTNNRVRCHYYCEDSRSRFYAIAEDEHGTIWFGGNEGVCFLRPDSKDVEFLKENFETTVNDIVPLFDDYLLCSTAGNGVFLIKNGKVLKNWHEEDGLSSNSCSRILKLDNQNVFVATTKGVTRLRFDPNNPMNMYPIVYGGKDAKPALFVNDLLLDGEQLYIASNEGLYSFKINDLKIQRNLPIVRLTQPSAYLIKPDTFLQLRYGWFYQEAEIKFNFRAIAFCNGEVMHFRYRLLRDGVLEKRDSIVLHEDFTLSLVSLNSGSYILEVEASRGDGIWSKPVRTRFEVPRAIYRRPLAYFLYWLIITLSMFEFFRWRSRRRTLREQRALAHKEERLALERRQLEWEQEAIRARIDPHFVFNALNGILTFVYKRDVESIKIQLPRLARFIRTSLNLGKEDFINIEQEVQYLNDYLSIEKRRFEEKFDYSITITEGVDTQRKILPPLLLQIFVENAVRHGISPLSEIEKGIISIVFEPIPDGGVRCVLTDNGIGFSKSMNDKTVDEAHQSMGLNLAKRRISILNQIYSEKYVLDISDTGDGTRVELKITK